MVQVKDTWVFQMTGRHKEYGEFLTECTIPDSCLHTPLVANVFSSICCYPNVQSLEAPGCFSPEWGNVERYLNRLGLLVREFASFPICTVAHSREHMFQQPLLCI